MTFGEVGLDEAAGAILAHGVRLGGGRLLAKGTLLTPDTIEALRSAGHAGVVVARLDAGDTGEDEAATLIATACEVPGVERKAAGTGRVNLHAGQAGLFRAERQRVDALNACDPGITLATLADATPVEAGRMVATVKIIPYGVPTDAVAQVTRLAAGAMSLSPFRARPVGVLSTLLPALKPSVVDKTVRVLASRLERSGSWICAERRCAHETAPVASAVNDLRAAGAELVVVFGASAISDRRDVVPAAIEQAGGRIVRFGMPVDPGNLLLLAELDGVPVLGAPGCARSPAENGFDWVLDRLLADIEVTSGDVAGMGVGGLLMEIASRPRPRQATAPVRAAAIVLAAGLSRRMGGATKMLEPLDGAPLVRHAVREALASRAGTVLVVTGHEGERVSQALDGLAARRVHNAAFAEGLASSLAAGLAAVPEGCSHALVLLGDMPQVTAVMIDRLLEAAAARPDAIIVATHAGQRGNPVVWPRADFPRLMQLTGDKGGRDLIDAAGDRLVAVELGAAAGFDIDTPEALAQARLTGGVTDAPRGRSDRQRSEQ